MSVRKRFEGPHDHLGHKCGPTGKKIFKSEKHAWLRASEILERGANGTDGFRVYHCPHCNFYHLTSKI
jgi:hypothetical protein